MVLWVNAEIHKKGLNSSQDTVKTERQTVGSRDCQVKVRWSAVPAAEAGRTKYAGHHEKH